MATFWVLLEKHVPATGLGPSRSLKDWEQDLASAAYFHARKEAEKVRKGSPTPEDFEVAEVKVDVN